MGNETSQQQQQQQQQPQQQQPQYEKITMSNKNKDSKRMHRFQHVVSNFSYQPYLQVCTELDLIFTCADPSENKKATLIFDATAETNFAQLAELPSRGDSNGFPIQLGVCSETKRLAAFESDNTNVQKKINQSTVVVYDLQPVLDLQRKLKETKSKKAESILAEKDLPVVQNQFDKKYWSGNSSNLSRGPSPGRSAYTIALRRDRLLFCSFTQASNHFSCIFIYSVKDGSRIVDGGFYLQDFKDVAFVHSSWLTSFSSSSSSPASCSATSAASSTAMSQDQTGTTLDDVVLFATVPSNPANACPSLVAVDARTGKRIQLPGPVGEEIEFECSPVRVVVSPNSRYVAHTYNAKSSGLNSNAEAKDQIVNLYRNEGLCSAEKPGSGGKEDHMLVLTLVRKFDLRHYVNSICLSNQVLGVANNIGYRVASNTHTSNFKKQEELPDDGTNDVIEIFGLENNKKLDGVKYIVNLDEKQGPLLQATRPVSIGFLSKPSLLAVTCYANEIKTASSNSPQDVKGALAVLRVASLWELRKKVLLIQMRGSKENNRIVSLLNEEWVVLRTVCCFVV